MKPVTADALTLATLEMEQNTGGETRTFYATIRVGSVAEDVP